MKFVTPEILIEDSGIDSKLSVGEKDNHKISTDFFIRKVRIFLQEYYIFESFSVVKPLDHQYFQCSAVVTLCSKVFPVFD